MKLAFYRPSTEPFPALSSAKWGTAATFGGAPGAIWASGGDGSTTAVVAKSTDYGQSWSSPLTVWTQTTPGTVQGIAVSGTYLYVSGAEGVTAAKSSDAGATWAALGYPTGWGTTPGGGDLNFLAAKGSLVLRSGVLRNFAGSFASVAYSNDHGSTWHLPSSPVVTRSGNTYYGPFLGNRAPVAFNSATVVMMVYDGTIAVSSDGGANWITKGFSFYTPTHCVPVKLGATGKTWIIGALGSSGEVSIFFTSTDTGTSWLRVAVTNVHTYTPTEPGSFQLATVPTRTTVTTKSVFFSGGEFWGPVWAAQGHAPPNRQFPRDDGLGLGSPRQRGGRGMPSSRQSSTRQGSRGTYT